jgi:hypothetical protein
MRLAKDRGQPLLLSQEEFTSYQRHQLSLPLQNPLWHPLRQHSYEEFCYEMLDLVINKKLLIHKSVMKEILVKYCSLDKIPFCLAKIECLLVHCYQKGQIEEVKALLQNHNLFFYLRKLSLLQDIPSSSLALASYFGKTEEVQKLDSSDKELLCVIRVFAALGAQEELFVWCINKCPGQLVDMDRDKFYPALQNGHMEFILNILIRQADLNPDEK